MFHENLKRARTNKGMSQEQLAVQLHVVRQTVSKWEKGLSVPDAETLVNISETLETPVNELLGETMKDENIQLSDVAEQLAKLNELLAIRMEKRENGIKILKKTLLIVLLILFMIAIYPRWTEMWHEFGGNLYHILNK